MVQTRPLTTNSLTCFGLLLEGPTVPTGTLRDTNLHFLKEDAAAWNQTQTLSYHPSLQLALAASCLGSSIATASFPPSLPLSLVSLSLHLNSRQQITLLKLHDPVWNMSACLASACPHCIPALASQQVKCLLPQEPPQTVHTVSREKHIPLKLDYSTALLLTSNVDHTI